jgi:hypothetical protein
VSTSLSSGATYSLSPTPGGQTDIGRDFTVHSGWEITGQGLTPVGEGVFREFMGMGPGMGPMDIGWDIAP